MSTPENRPTSASARPSRLRSLGLLSSSAALATAALVGPVGSAISAPVDPVGSACPTAYPASSLTKGDAVTGLTVTEGTTPEAFTGEFVGVSADGIAPGTDLLIFKMAGSDITKSDGAVDKGIWAGMSGSPVYASDGRLIGAVSYGFSALSEYAGVTPAEDMYKLRDYAGPAAGQAAARVKVTGTLASRMRAQGASARTVESGARRLQVPMSISGRLGSKQLTKLARKTGEKNRSFVRGTSPVGKAAAEIPIVAGGNVGNTFSYGDITAGGVGTATAVCGDDVLAYGHPTEDYVGPSDDTMHGAEALYVERDATYGAYKFANFGAPVGQITQDRSAGLLGRLGQRAPLATISTTTQVNGKTRAGKTFVSYNDAMPFVTAAQVGSDTVTAQDGNQAGTSELVWKYVIQRKNGSRLTFTRSDRVSAPSFLSDETPAGPATDLEKILGNEFEDVKVVDAQVKTKIENRYHAYKITGVEVIQNKKWVKATTGKRVYANSGASMRVRVTMKPERRSDGATKQVQIRVAVPSKTQRKSGTLVLAGGAPMFYDEADDEEYEDLEDEFYDEDYEEDYVYAPPAKPTSLPALLASMKKTPRSDAILANLNIRSGSTLKARSAAGRAPSKVSGHVQLRVTIRNK